MLEVSFMGSVQRLQTHQSHGKYPWNNEIAMSNEIAVHHGQKQEKDLLHTSVRYGGDLENK